MSHPPHTTESLFERAIFGSRWLQAPLYAGLIVAQGIYVWQHTWKAGQCSWRPALHCKGAFLPLTRYRLAVEFGVHPGGKELAVTCGDTAFSFFADALPDAYYVGLTACEGVNRFYDFSVASNA